MVRLPLRTATLAAALALVFASPALAGELVENGGFETGSFSPWFAPPSVPGQSLFLVGGDGFAHSGMRYAYLSSTQLQYIGQVLATIAGEDYELSFWIQSTGLGFATFRVPWEGQVVLATGFGGTMEWQHYTLPLHSNITGSYLEFRQNRFPGAWLLDDVSVRPIPAPGAAALLGMVGGAVAAMRRRTRF